MSKATISDVAQAAGVSTKSVSRVINREPNVSARLLAKVQAAIDSLGYVPDQAARSLAGSRSFLLGIFLDNPSPNYTMKLLAGANKACRAHGYHLQIENLATDQPDLSAQLDALLRNMRVDGVILTPPLSGCSVTMTALEARGIRYVRLAPDGFEGRAPAVAINDCEAGWLVGDHLARRGHRHFGFVQGPARHRAAEDRREGFLAALAAHGLEPAVEVYGGFEFERSIAAGKDLLSRVDRPTAIFAANDDSAAGVMAAAAELHLRVPGDVAIVGFDDSWIARSVWPNLTTVYQPIAEMAEHAVAILLDRAGRAERNDTLWLDYHLVERGSTLAPPAPAKTETPAG